LDRWSAVPPFKNGLCSSKGMKNPLPAAAAILIAAAEWSPWNPGKLGYPGWKLPPKWATLGVIERELTGIGIVGPPLAAEPNPGKAPAKVENAGCRFEGAFEGARGFVLGLLGGGGLFVPNERSESEPMSQSLGAGECGGVLSSVSVSVDSGLLPPMFR